MGGCFAVLEWLMNWKKDGVVEALCAKTGSDASEVFKQGMNFRPGVQSGNQNRKGQG